MEFPAIIIYPHIDEKRGWRQYAVSKGAESRGWWKPGTSKYSRKSLRSFSFEQSPG